MASASYLDPLPDIMKGTRLPVGGPSSTGNCGGLLLVDHPYPRLAADGQFSRSTPLLRENCPNINCRVSRSRVDLLMAGQVALQSITTIQAS